LTTFATPTTRTKSTTSGRSRPKGTRFFFKVDYFDRTLNYHSPDPTDPAVTVRVITVMLADEY
jgi:hypothetical protein